MKLNKKLTTKKSDVYFERERKLRRKKLKPAYKAACKYLKITAFIKNKFRLLNSIYFNLK